ncbi:uroporphyrinogen-III synthase [Chitinophaga sancti]|uniref:Uroporphyrinogen-III synthase n=1 Tax=Chitinophaga sancti TaxID=1004 RepID=A0A1K1QLD8_9BACT|nr:uroporphyrinogen-III synthase [Chitinophaga sancti]WQD65150.1 uroporphyrinogen-III synthase [Chitinophaga sancti]WQG89226.1 uroporphyrinogen-III synthase [Chitinophaga sancti]SFW60508.1 uroporphyrinogen-III synthase [Chitinophaga sancti]
MQGNYRILSTKDLPAPLLESAAQQGFEITVQAFIRIQPVITTTLKETITQLLSTVETCVFTSAHAVTSIQDFAQPAQIYCLAGATLEAVNKAFPKAAILATAHDAAALATKIERSSVLFFCGNQRRDELPDLLKQRGILLKEVVVYETIAVETALHTDFDGILFFSPSGVHSYFAANKKPAHTVCFAIGHTTAQALKTYTGTIVVNPGKPSAAQLIQTAITYFNIHN